MNLRLYRKLNFSGSYEYCSEPTIWWEVSVDDDCVMDYALGGPSAYAIGDGTIYDPAPACFDTDAPSAPFAPEHCGAYDAETPGEGFEIDSDTTGHYPAIPDERTGVVNCLLHDPDDVYTGFSRGEIVTSGAGCKTTAGDYFFTDEGAVAYINLENATGVTVTINLTGLTPAAAYTVTANINRYTAGGGAFVDAIQVEIDFAADGASDTVNYQVPVNTDFDYEFASIASVALA